MADCLMYDMALPCILNLYLAGRGFGHSLLMNPAGHGAKGTLICDLCHASCVLACWDLFDAKMNVEWLFDPQQG